MATTSKYLDQEGVEGLWLKQKQWNLTHIAPPFAGKALSLADGTGGSVQHQSIDNDSRLDVYLVGNEMAVLNPADGKYYSNWNVYTEGGDLLGTGAEIYGTAPAFHCTADNSLWLRTPAGDIVNVGVFVADVEAIQSTIEALNTALQGHADKIATATELGHVKVATRDDEENPNAQGIDWTYANVVMETETTATGSAPTGVIKYHYPKLAAKDEVYTQQGHPLGRKYGNDGLMSKEDKAALDDMKTDVAALKQAATTSANFKGSIGPDGADVSALPATHKTGDEYVVQLPDDMATWTLGSFELEDGDFIRCKATGTAANDEDWTVLQANVQPIPVAFINSLD